jgi:5-methylcytosine-specific restriction endonuclease McrA
VFREETHCWICGRYVDQTLRPGKGVNRDRTVDHLRMLSEGGAELARDNVRLAHRGCNTSLSNRRRAGRGRRRPQLVTSRQW